jgi:hypothetical protein
MEGAREASLGGDEGSEPLDPLGERRKGRVHIGEHNGRIRARIDLPSEYGRDQVRATWEAAVEGGYPDPSRVRNLTHRSIYSRRCKHRFRRIEQSVEAALRVGAPRPFSAQAALAVAPSVVCRRRHQWTSCKTERRSALYGRVFRFNASFQQRLYLSHEVGEPDAR